MTNGTGAAKESPAPAQLRLASGDHAAEELAAAPSLLQARALVGWRGGGVLGADPALGIVGQTLGAQAGRRRRALDLRAAGVGLQGAEKTDAAIASPVHDHLAQVWFEPRA